MEQQIAARIAELEAERDDFVRQANTQVAAYNAVINELRRLVAPPAPEADADKAETPSAE